MEAHAHDDPIAFLREVQAPLARREGRNQLLLGIAGTLRDAPWRHAEFGLWQVVDPAGDLAGAAVVTPPHRLVLADLDDGAVLPLARAVAASAHRAITGVVGNQPSVDRFVAAWGDTTGQAMVRTLLQGVYELVEVTTPPPAPGRPRRAGRQDTPRLTDWVAAFCAEVPMDPRAPSAAAQVEGRLATPGAGFWLWSIDGEPVALAGYGGATPTGIRIGPVYTPPAHRGRGYAGSLVAALSQHLLDEGRRACFLYTDLDNPTSNDLYRRLGYRQVGEAAAYDRT